MRKIYYGKAVYNNKEIKAGLKLKLIINQIQFLLCLLSYLRLKMNFLKRKIRIPYCS